MHLGLFINLGMRQGVDSSDLAHFAHIVAHYQIFLIVLNPNFYSTQSAHRSIFSIVKLIIETLSFTFA